MKSRINLRREANDGGAICSNSTSSSSNDGSVVVYIPPTVAIFRWAILFVTCTITLGNYFCFDIPSVLYEPLAELFGNMDYFEVNFNLLYIVYSLPNIVLPLFGGFMIDQWGQRNMIVTFSLAILCGQVIIAMGCTMKSFSIMIFGRFLFGLGGESLMVSIVSLLSSWFEGKELAFALGLMLSLSRIGSAANAWISPVLEAEKGVTVVFWFGAFLCFLSVLATFSVVALDLKYKSQFENIDFGVASTGEDDDFNGGWDASDPGCRTLGASPSSSPSSSVADTELVTFANTQANARIGMLFRTEPAAASTTTSGVIHDDGAGSVCGEPVSRIMFADQPSQVITEELQPVDEETPLTVDGIDAGSESSSPEPKRDYFTLADLQAHRRALWPPSENRIVWCVFSCTFFVYGAIVPFIYLANQIIRVTYFHSASIHNADYMEYIIPRLQSIPFLLSACMSPLVGMTVDYCGYRTCLVATAPVMLVGAHLFMSFALWNPYIPLILIGMAYSVFVASIWPVIPLVVDSHLHGLAFGIMTSIQNLSQTLVPALVSIILSPHEEPLLYHHHGHTRLKVHPPPDLATMKGIAHTEIFFAALSVVGVVCALMLWYFDEWPGFGPGGLLRKTTKITIDVLHKEYEDNLSTGQPPLPPRTTVAPPIVPAGEDEVGIAFNKMRGGSTEAKSMPIPLPQQHATQSYGALKGDAKPSSQSPQYAIPYEAFANAAAATESTSLIPSDGVPKHRNYSSSAPFLTMSIGGMSNIMDDQCMEEGMMSMKKAVSFAGDVVRFPERKPGQGQHPAIPLKRRNSTMAPKMKFAHF